MGAPRGVEDFNLAAPATVLLETAVQAASRYLARPEHSLARSVRHNRKSYADVRIDLSTRVKYGGGKHGSGMFGSTIFYSGQRPYLFAHAFADCGEIIIYNRPKRPL